MKNKQERFKGMTVERLEELKNTDIKTVDKDSLVDLRDIKINRKLPAEERIREFVARIENPYCFKVGEVAVKVAFSPDGGSFEECFEKMLSGFL